MPARLRFRRLLASGFWLLTPILELQELLELLELLFLFLFAAISLIDGRHCRPAPGANFSRA